MPFLLGGHDVTVTPARGERTALMPHGVSCPQGKGRDDTGVPRVSIPPCPHVPMPSCPRVHMSPTPHVPVSPCPRVHMSPCPRVHMPRVSPCPQKKGRDVTVLTGAHCLAALPMPHPSLGLITRAPGRPTQPLERALRARKIGRIAGGDCYEEPPIPPPPSKRP